MATAHGDRGVLGADSGGLHFRLAEPADVDRVVAIERASFSDPWSRASFAALVGDPRVLFVVAERDPGDVVGYIVTWFVLDEGEIANVAVAESARGTGVGARLLDIAIDVARRRGATALYLEVRESNAVARRLYASRGFSEVGRRRNYYRRPVEDALVLRLIVGRPAG